MAKRLILVMVTFGFGGLAIASERCGHQFEHERAAAIERATEKLAWGRARLQVGDFEAAAWAAESASVMASTPNVDALLLKAEAYLSLNAPDQSYRILERILIIAGQNHLEAVALKVRALYLLGRKDETLLAIAQVRAIRGFLLPIENRILQDLKS